MNQRETETTRRRRSRRCRLGFTPPIAEAHLRDKKKDGQQRMRAHSEMPRKRHIKRKPSSTAALDGVPCLFPRIVSGTHDDSCIGHYLSALRDGESGDDADGRLPHLLCMHDVRRDAAAEARRLLRVLFLRFCSVSTDPGRAVRRRGRRLLLLLTTAARDAAA